MKDRKRRDPTGQVRNSKMTDKKTDAAAKANEQSSEEDNMGLAEVAKNRSAGTEDANSYDGVFSYAGEFHAFFIGIGAGFAAAIAGEPMVAASVIATAIGIRGVGKLEGKFAGRGVISELRREPWYAVGGTLLGYGVTSGVWNITEVVRTLIGM